MGNADAFSRLPLPVIISSGNEDLVMLVDDSVFDAKQVAQLTARDPLLYRLMNLVQNGGWPAEVDAGLKPFSDKRVEMSVCAGVLLWGHRVVIPQRARQSVNVRQASSRFISIYRLIFSKGGTPQMSLKSSKMIERNLLITISIKAKLGPT